MVRVTPFEPWLNWADLLRGSILRISRSELPPTICRSLRRSRRRYVFDLPDDTAAPKFAKKFLWRHDLRAIVGSAPHFFAADDDFSF